MDYYLDNTKVFKALGDPKRAMIVDKLSCGELCACDILEKFEMSQSTLSHHMKILCESGIVTSREEGKWTHYQISRQGSEKAVALLKTITAVEETDAEESRCCP